MDNKIKEFAPVIIPTLCRYNHLKRLLESLEICKYADKTEVYIGVDYPANDKHRPGYEKIKEYLEAKQFRFKKVHIIYRERNYGIGDNGNQWDLFQRVSRHHKRYIFTEDDNEFSPNFLEYINLNLERYENDSSVLFVCGYLSKDLKLNTVYTQYSTKYKFVAWGYGGWFSKSSFLFDKNIYQILLNHPKIKDFTKTYIGKSLYMSLIRMSKGSPRLGDVIMATYQNLYDVTSIFPTISKVRNYGWDGTGSHGGYTPGISEEYFNQPIDAHYDYIEINEAPDSFAEEVGMMQREKRRQTMRRLKDKILTLSSYYLYSKLHIFWDTAKFSQKIKAIKTIINN